MSAPGQRATVTTGLSPIHLIQVKVTFITAVLPISAQIPVIAVLLPIVSTTTCIHVVIGCAPTILVQGWLQFTVKLEVGHKPFIGTRVE